MQSYKLWDNWNVLAHKTPTSFLISCYKALLLACHIHSIIFSISLLIADLCPESGKQPMSIPSTRKVQHLALRITNQSPWHVPTVEEKIINITILHHLISLDLISPQQHGFRPLKSTTTNLLECVYHWTTLQQLRQQIDIIYFDFQKAFDSISHPKLLNKVKSNGITGNLFQWLSDFLYQRKQHVLINDSISGSDLKFQLHIDNIIHKAAIRSRLILKSFTSRDKNLFTKAFCVYVRTILEYSCHVWNPHHKYLIEGIEKIQKRFTKAIPAVGQLKYQDRHWNSNLSTSAYLNSMYKIINNLTSTYLKNHIHFTNSSSTRGHQFKLRSNFFAIDNTKSIHLPPQWLWLFTISLLQLIAPLVSFLNFLLVW